MITSNLVFKFWTLLLWARAASSPPDCLNKRYDLVSRHFSKIELASHAPWIRFQDLSQTQSVLMLCNERNISFRNCLLCLSMVPFLTMKTFHGLGGLSSDLFFDLHKSVYGRLLFEWRTSAESHRLGMAWRWAIWRAQTSKLVTLKSHNPHFSIFAKTNWITFTMNDHTLVMCT